MEMEKDFDEYVTFTVTDKNGAEVEMAVVDEFDFEDEHYVVGAVIEEDTIIDDAHYIYRSIIDKDGFIVEKIRREFDYNRIAEAYMEMDMQGSYRKGEIFADAEISPFQMLKLKIIQLVLILHQLEQGSNNRSLQPDEIHPMLFQSVLDFHIGQLP